jgi:predicted DsbA family dithiol-disulfide isomerase
MTIKIEYFSDVLCVWAYSGQIRMDELKHEFGEQIEIEYRFVPIFGAGKQHVENTWKDEGGVSGFNQHLQDVAKNWPHISLSADLWTKVAPQSSISAHQYLKAVQLLQQHGDIENISVEAFDGRTHFEQTLWLFRDAFFRQGKDISQRCVQDEIAEELTLPLKKIHTLLDNGLAHAELHKDNEAQQEYKVPGSPTLILNEGRQLLYGNVGYRIIDANVRELLHNPSLSEASWC